MKKLLLDTKWIGVGLAIIFSLAIAWITTSKTSLFVKTVTPYIAEEAQAFLPITIEDGAIVEPKDTIISKEYNLNNKTIYVILNTEVDELSADEIKNSGLYFSRKYMYGVTPQKTEIRSLQDLPNITVDSKMFNEGVKWLETYVDGYLFAVIFVMMMAWIGFAVLIYSALSQLLLGRVVSPAFARTLRITTLGYLVLLIIELGTGFNINILIKLVSLVLLNYLINKQFYHVEK